VVLAVVLAVVLVVVLEADLRGLLAFRYLTVYMAKWLT
jgi:hypothetical protein